MSVQMFRDLMRQTVSLETHAGVDSYGQSSYEAGQDYRARVVGKVRMVRNWQGQEVGSSHTVYLASNPGVTVKDRLTLSTGDAGSTEATVRQPAILSVGNFPDERGRHHTVLFLA